MLALLAKKFFTARYRFRSRDSALPSPRDAHDGRAFLTTGDSSTE